IDLVVEAPQPIARRLIALVDHFGVFLRHVADARFVAPLELALVRLELAFEQTQQGGFADAVRANQRDLVPARYVQVEILADHLVVEGLAQVLDVQHVLAAWTRLIKADERSLDVRTLQIAERGALALQLLLAGLDLACTRAGAK